MSIIGRTICEARKSKGLTQEELAESTKINLRTIQRIENNENEPRGKTLNLICDVLDINMEDVLNSQKQEDLINSNLFYGYKLASKGTRLLANLTEFFIFFIIIGVPLIIFKIVTKDFNPYGPKITSPEHVAIFSIIIGAIFYPIFTGNLGHKIYNLKVISSESGNDYDKAYEGAIREFLKWMLSILIFPMIWILWDDKNQNLYDKLTKTLVVEKKTNR